MLGARVVTVLSEQIPRAFTMRGGSTRRPDAMLPDDDSIDALRDARGRFLALVADVRPDLHRYCARMMGSVVDGEDVVQDTLARALYRLPELPVVPELRPWLFRVAHNRAIDLLRRHDRRMGEPLEGEPAAGDAAAEEELARKQAMAFALARFLELPPIPRACVILKDVLGHTTAEAADTLDLSIPAVKAALHRGRSTLREMSAREAPEPDRGPPSDVVVCYVELFNARDWEGVRAMLSDDVRLDVVGRSQRRGREAAQYTHNYDRHHDWYLRPAWLDGREVIAVYQDSESATPTYFVALEIDGGRVTAIRDFRYVPYIATDARLR